MSGAASYGAASARRLAAAPASIVAFACGPAAVASSIVAALTGAEATCAAVATASPVTGGCTRASRSRATTAAYTATCAIAATGGTASTASGPPSAAVADAIAPTNAAPDAPAVTMTSPAA